MSVQITAPPVDGEANLAIIKYFAEILHLKKTDVSLKVMLCVIISHKLEELYLSIFKCMQGKSVSYFCNDISSREENHV